MTKVVFFFGGTGDKNSGMKDKHFQLKKDVIRVHIAGCQNTKVGNGYVFPDLDIGAKNLRAAFNNGNLSKEDLLKNLGGNDVVEIKGWPSGSIKTVKIKSIALSGFSRGGVSCFAAARHLDELGISMHIIANQPVPGNTSSTATRAHSEFNKNQDLSNCKNIKSSKTIIGAYSKGVIFYENKYFKQMLAKMPSESESTAISLPFQQHHQWIKDIGDRMLVKNHIGVYLAKQGFSEQSDDYFNGELAKNIKKAFLPKQLRQKVLGQHNATLIEDSTEESLIIKQAKLLITPLVNMNIINKELVDKLTLKQSKALNYLIAFNKSIVTLNKSTAIKLPKLPMVEFYNLLLSNDEYGNNLCNIIIDVNDTCQCMIDRIIGYDSITNDKRKLLKSEVVNYKCDIYKLSKDYLKKDSPITTKKFKKGIRLAEINLAIKATGIHRSRSRATQVFLKVLSALTNIIFFIVSVPIRLKTKKWIDFNKTISQERMSELTDQIDTISNSQDALNSLDHLDSELTNEATGSHSDDYEANITPTVDGSIKPLRSGAGF